MLSSCRAPNPGARQVWEPLAWRGHLPSPWQCMLVHMGTPTLKQSPQAGDREVLYLPPLGDKPRLKWQHAFNYSHLVLCNMHCNKTQPRFRGSSYHKPIKKKKKKPLPPNLPSAAKPRPEPGAPAMPGGNNSLQPVQWVPGGFSHASAVAKSSKAPGTGWRWRWVHHPALRGLSGGEGEEGAVGSPGGEGTPAAGDGVHREGGSARWVGFH